MSLCEESSFLPFFVSEWMSEWVGERASERVKQLGPKSWGRAVSTFMNF